METTKKTFVVISDPNQTNGDTDFRIHIMGCRDIKRELKKPGFAMAGNAWEHAAESAAAVVAAEVAGFQANEQGYGPADFTICDCAK